jgi:Mrp family chromosome partitioning ATPase
MAENCTHNCDTCKAGCSNSTAKFEKLKLSSGSDIKKIIGISSGKGGVGKSFVTSMIATTLTKQGFKVGILDGDIVGPSIPKSFGIKTEGAIQATDEQLLIPAQSKSGIKIMSSGLLTESDGTPIIYRGSLLVSLLQQFYTDVFWADLDYLLIDMPPGTGDIPLTVYQMFPIDGVVIASSPQSLVSMIVEKSINMATKMGIKIVGLVENMSYVECPNCKEKIKIFGESKIEEICKKNNIKLLAQVPLRADYSSFIDSGKVEDLEVPEFNNVIEEIKKL